jgi:hypothetical protein
MRTTAIAGQRGALGLAQVEWFRAVRPSLVVKEGRQRFPPEQLSTIPHHSDTLHDVEPAIMTAIVLSTATKTQVEPCVWAGAPPTSLGLVFFSLSAYKNGEY